MNLDVSVKAYPWLGYEYNLGGIIAASVFAILGALAFMSNVVIIMKSIVVEKELRLREGMQMMVGTFEVGVPGYMPVFTGIRVARLGGRRGLCV